MSVDGSEVYHGFCLRVIRDRGGSVKVSELYQASYGITQQLIFELFDEGFISMQPEPKMLNLGEYTGPITEKFDKSYLRQIDPSSSVELTEKGVMALEKRAV